jgi:hypothetical protein
MNTFSSRLSLAGLLSALCMAAPSTARATAPGPQPVTAAPAPEQRPPLSARIVDRALVLPSTSVEITLPVNATLSGGLANSLTVNPSIYFGVNDQVTVGVRPYMGLCVSAANAADGCQRMFNDLSLEVVASFLDSAVFDLAGSLAVNAAPVVEAMSMSGDARLIARIASGDWALAIAPMINHGFNSRSEGEKIVGAVFPLATYAFGGSQRIAGNRDFIAVPASFQFQLYPAVALVVGASLQGPLNPLEGTFASTFTVPVGFASVFAIASGFDVGAALTFPDVRNGLTSQTVTLLAAFRPR